MIASEIRLGFLTVILLVLSLDLYGQDCSQPLRKKYREVLTPPLSQQFEECPVIIEGSFLKEGFLTGYRKPKKFKNYLYFQCTSVNGETMKDQLGNTHGHIFIADITEAKKVLGFHEGDRLELTGTTFTQNYFGVELGVFFVVSHIKKLEADY